MSLMSTSRYTKLKPQQFDENGKPLCRWCNGPLSGRRTAWCSQKCVDEYLERSTSPRSRVFERDGGICAGCGVDMHTLRHRFDRVMRRLFARGHFDLMEAFGKHYISKGYPVHGGYYKRGRWFNPYQSSRTWWEADHILPVVEGGGECGLDNYRTLCVLCHKAESKKLVRRLANKRRRQSGQAPLPKTPEEAGQIILL
jgi:5-methylcytosine-specific restriction protein A